MFNQPDNKLLSSSYFTMIRQTEDYVEIQSKNTKHCWIIRKQSFSNTAPILIYHKHASSDSYYHKHRYSHSVKSAIQQIKNHDDFVLNPTNEIMASPKTSHYETILT